MSLFGTILEKLGMGGAQAGPASQAGASRTAAPGSPGAARTDPPSGSTSSPSATPKPAPVAPVDVAAQLEQRAAANPQKLNWRTSIVDLLKLLDIDSSLSARKKLATELGCPPDLMGDSAKMNRWLHETVLARIAANGGKVPEDLLH